MNIYSIIRIKFAILILMHIFASEMRKSNDIHHLHHHIG